MIQIATNFLHWCVSEQLEEMAGAEKRPAPGGRSCPNVLMVEAYLAHGGDRGASGVLTNWRSRRRRRGKAWALITLTVGRARWLRPRRGRHRRRYPACARPGDGRSLGALEVGDPVLDPQPPVVEVLSPGRLAAERHAVLLGYLANADDPFMRHAARSEIGDVLRAATRMKSANDPKGSPAGSRANNLTDRR